MDALINLGKEIVKKRMQLGLTQKDLASMTGISDVTIRLIEKGGGGSSIKNWMTIADALGMELILTTKRMSDETRKGI